MCVHITDPRELSLPDVGILGVVDPETATIVSATDVFARWVGTNLADGVRARLGLAAGSIVEVRNDVFTVALIPHTSEVTTLGRRAVGDPVNIEVDVMAKYAERLLGGVLDRTRSESEDPS